MAKTRKEVEQYHRDLVQQIDTFMINKGIGWTGLVNLYPALKNRKSSFDKRKTTEATASSIEYFYNVIFNNDETSTYHIAAQEHGGYTRETYTKYEGKYAFIRPSTTEDGVIYGYYAHIKWDVAAKYHYLEIEHSQNQFGRGKMYLMPEFNTFSVHFSSMNNQSIMFLQLPVGNQINLYGILMSVLPFGPDETYKPGCTPAVLVKEDKHIPLESGYINASHPLYELCVPLISNAYSKSAVTEGWWSTKK